MAKKPKITQKHVDNANEIAQILSALKDQSEPAQAPAQAPVLSPLGGQAK